MKFEKGYKCPKELKRQCMNDKEALKILMHADATYKRWHREAMKRKGNRDTAGAAPEAA